jgi:DNA-binding XRE family transcriptional regulator
MHTRPQKKPSMDLAPLVEAAVTLFGTVTPIRCSEPNGLASHRKRLDLSAENLGKLLGVSGQTIYHWEAGKARPRASQMPAIAALRKLGKRTALAVLATR